VQHEAGEPLVADDDVAAAAEDEHGQPAPGRPVQAGLDGLAVEGLQVVPGGPAHAERAESAQGHVVVDVQRAGSHP
jgi:hypothetical protein